MNARNLGVVFGRKCLALELRKLTRSPSKYTATLMRHRDPGQEFSDMAGKAQTVEWLINHAQTVFKDAEPLPST